MRKILLATILAASAVTSPVFAASVTYDDITFPDGDISFADTLIDLSFGTPAPTDPNFIFGNQALGAPDYTGNLGTGSVSLGSGGSITLRFDNNALTGSDSDSFDLHIFEIGPDVEDTFVEISKDGNTWSSVGKVFGSTSSIDIDAFGFDSSDLFRFVRLTDDPNEGASSGSTVGADIDAVGAITTVPLDVVPLPASLLFLISGAGLFSIIRKRHS